MKKMLVFSVLVSLLVSVVACATPVSPAAPAQPVVTSTVLPPAQPAVTPTVLPPAQPAATATVVPPAKPASLTLDSLKNAEYQTNVTASKKAKLTDGKFQEPAAAGSASMLTVVLITNTVTFGDLNADGVDDAVVVLAAGGSGSGTFINLNAVLNDKGVARHIAVADLGDRTQVKSISIQGGEISVNMLKHGANDPLCCPTQQAAAKYRLQGDKLVEIK